MSNIVVIVGRPNVGKSTLFNRLVGRRLAIVHPISGVTRDRIYGSASWGTRSFEVVDTGGLISRAESLVSKNIRVQVEYALKQAAAAILLTDGRSGLHPEDSQIAQMLYRVGIPFLIAVNKIDQYKDADRANEFYALGREKVFPLSAEHGTGVDDLLDELLNVLPEATEEEGPENVLRLLILGRPNVGKSTLLNTILKEDRAIVDEQPGTTRDLLTEIFKHGDQVLSITDSAGLRKKARVKAPIEFYSVLRAINYIDRCDVALLLTDATELITNQDKKIAELVLTKGKGLLLAVNKIDLARKAERSEINARIHQAAPFLKGIPIMTISALKGTGVEPLLSRAVLVYHEGQKWVDKHTLQQILTDLRPPADRVRLVNLKQVGRAPPTFIAVASRPLGAVYIRYLENQLRNYFGLEGNPIVINTRIARFQ